MPVTILNNAGKNLEKLLVSLYTFYFPSRSNYFKIFFSVEDTKIQKFKLNRKKETSVSLLNLNFIIGKEQVRNVNINVTSGSSTVDRMSATRAVSSDFWLVAIQRKRAGNSRQGEATKWKAKPFEPNTDPIERGQDPVRPRHFNPCIGACNLETVLPYLALDRIDSKKIRCRNSMREFRR